MAKALQCTSCGATTRIDTLADGATFQCESCGQVMKVPPGLAGRSSGGRSPAAAAAATPSAGPSVDAPAPTVAPPAPRRRSRSTAAAGAAAAGAAAVGGGTAVLTPGSAPLAAPAPSSVPAPAGRSSRRSIRSGGARDKGRDSLPLWMRIATWVLALPIALAIVGIPARQLGYLTSQKLLDVIVKRDLSRFVPILVIVVLWAFVTAVLVTVFIEGGRRLMLRHRARVAERRQSAALDGGLESASSGRRGRRGRRK